MISEIIVESGGGKKVNVITENFTIKTDQSRLSGGEQSAPEPFTLFLASIGSCAGIYVFSFCNSRNIPTDGIRIIQRMHFDEKKKMIDKIELEIELNEEFPAKYKKAVVRSANLCAVKKHLLDAPEFEITALLPSERESA